MKERPKRRLLVNSASCAPFMDHLYQINLMFIRLVDVQFFSFVYVFISFYVTIQSFVNYRVLGYCQKFLYVLDVFGSFV